MSKRIVSKIDKFYGLVCSPDGYSGLNSGESTDMVNFRITNGNKLEKRKGYRKVFIADDTIRGAFCGNVGGEKRYYILDGETLYTSTYGFEGMVPMGSTIPGEDKVTFFPFAGKMYVFTGTNIYEIDSSVIMPVEAYIPTCMIGCTPDGAGTYYEDLNLLGNKAYQEFNFNEDETEYKLFLEDNITIESVTFDGVLCDPSIYYFNTVSKKLVFTGFPTTTPPKKMVVLFSYTTPAEKSAIISSKFATAYGGANDTRAFLYGSSQMPDVRFNTGMIDGKPSMSYFPTTGYTRIGNGDKITSIIRHYDRQLIFTEGGAYYSYLEYSTDSYSRMVASFPVYPLSSDKGNVAPGQPVLMQNDPVTITKTGLYKWSSTNIRDERNAKCVSDSIAQKFLAELPETAVFCDRKSTSELYIAFSDHVYVLNYLIGCFYYFEVCDISGMIEDETDFYFYNDGFVAITGGGSDNGANISVYWESKLFDFQDTQRIKNLFGVSITAKTEDDTFLNVYVTTNHQADVISSAFSLADGDLNPVCVKTVHHKIPKKRFETVKFIISNIGKTEILINEFDFDVVVTDKKV